MCWIVTKVLRSEDVRDDDVVEKARDGRLQGGSVHFGRDITAHESIGVVRRVGRHCGGCRVRVVVSRLPRKALPRVLNVNRFEDLYI